MGFKPLKLNIDSKLDKVSQENFQAIQSYVKADPFLRGLFRFIEISVSAAGTIDYPHGLNFQPTDVIPLSVRPDTAVIGWKYSSFTRDTISLSASAACVVRAFVGSYKE